MYRFENICEPMEGDLHEENMEFELTKNWEKAPLLLCSCSALLKSNLLSKWDGEVFTSSTIASKLNLEQKFRELAYNERTQIASNSNSDDGDMEIVMLPGLNKHEDSVMFLVKDKYMTTLLAGDPPTDAALNLDVLLTNKLLRQAIGDGIGRLLFDDTLLLTNCATLSASQPLDVTGRGLAIRTLTYFVKPEHVLTLTATCIPDSVKNLCREIEFDE